MKFRKSPYDFLEGIGCLLWPIFGALIFLPIATVLMLIGALFSGGMPEVLAELSRWDRWTYLALSLSGILYYWLYKTDW